MKLFLPQAIMGNKEGMPIEILNIKKDSSFKGGYGVLAVLCDGPSWVTIEWFFDDELEQARAKINSKRIAAKVKKERVKAKVEK